LTVAKCLCTSATRSRLISPSNILKTRLPPGESVSRQGEGQCDLAQLYGAGVVHGIASRDVRGHVGHDHVHAPSGEGEEFLPDLLPAHVALDGPHALQGLDGLQVHPYHPAPGPHALRGHLEPASRRRPKVDHGHALLEQAEALVELHELEGGPAAVVQLLGLPVIVIAPSLLHPVLGHADSPKPLQDKKPLPDR